VANTQITGNIVSSQIAPSVTLTTPIISGNLNLDSAGTTGIRAPSANTISFHTAGTEDVRIDANGNVGIGTASPNHQLQIGSTNGTVALGGGLTTNGTSRLKFLASNTVINWQISQNDSISGAFEITPSTVAGGSTFTTPAAAITAAGLFQFNSGYGSSATAYGCRAWVNFNGIGTVAIRASGNVSSITDNGTGNYTVNFTTAIVDANYAPVGTAEDVSTGNFVTGNAVTVPTTSGFTFFIVSSAGAVTDSARVNIGIFR
jgi:hypothetical protein